MMGALRCELLKLRRPGIVLGTFGVIVGMSLLIATILFATAKPQAEIVAEAIATAGQPGRSGPGISFEALAVPGGFALPFQFAAQIIGVVALVAFAQSFGSEYGQGTLKVLFSREPRRLRILAGKMTALGLLIVAAVLVAFLVQTLAAVLVAAAKGIPTDAWWTGQSLGDAALLAGRVALASLVWGSLGAFLAVLLRAAPPAIGIGIGYTLLVEAILAFALKGATKWLPGQAITAFVGWGASPNPELAALPAGWAALAVAVYALAFTGAAAILLVRSDVTS